MIDTFHCAARIGRLEIPGEVKMRTNVHILILLLSLFLLLFGSVRSAQADCTGLRFVGEGKSEEATEAISNYDRKAGIFNQIIKQADEEFLKTSNVNAIWPQVLLSRNELIEAGFAAKQALREMHDFNKSYLAAGCFKADPNQLKQEFQQSTAIFDSSLAILKSMPEDWQTRYSKVITCNALNAQTNQQKQRGAHWAQQYDGLIASYDTAKQNLTGVTLAAPQYASLRTKLITARDQAISGVAGYPEVLTSLHNLQLDKINEDCVAISEQALGQYKARHQSVLAEIRVKYLEMKNLETLHPLAPSHVITSAQVKSPVAKPPPPKATITSKLSNITSPKQPPQSNPIDMVNRSGQILCIHNPNTNDTTCNFMPNTSRQVQASNLTVFGGGYWSSNRQYNNMTVCHQFAPLPTQIIVTGGVSLGCSTNF